MCEIDDLQSLANRYRKLASQAKEAARDMPPSKWQIACRKVARHLTELADEIDVVLYAPDRGVLLN